MENTSETYGIWESISSETRGADVVLACINLLAISDLNMHLQLYLRFTCKLPHVASQGF
jgi:hypothetical protein